MIEVEIKDFSKEVLNAAEDQIIEALEKCGMVAEGYAKLKCPVDTGRLRGSISYEVKESERAMYVGTNVEYAPYVEYGTGRNSTVGGQQTIEGIKAKPYLKPSISEHTSEYKKIIKDTLKQ